MNSSALAVYKGKACLQANTPLTNLPIFFRQSYIILITISTPIRSLFLPWLHQLAFPYKAGNLVNIPVLCVNNG